MKTHFSKLALGLGAASMFLAGSAFSYQSIDDRIDALEKEMKEVSAKNAEGTYGAGFATARPETTHSRVFGFVDAIYWHPKMGGTEYAITYVPEDFFTLNFDINDQPVSITFALSHRPNGDMKENDFSWDWGLKAGIGYKTPHDAWDILARYTWLDSHSTSQSTKDYPSALFPLKVYMPFTPDFNAVNVAKSTVNIGYNNVDVELGRSFYLSKDFSFKPYIGLKGAWIDIEQKAYYLQKKTASILQLLVEFDSPEFKSDTKSNFCGFGPRIGFENKYYLNNGFNLFGDFSASILYGFFRTSQKDSIPNAGFGGLIPEDEVEQLEEFFNFTFSTDARDLKHKFHQYVPYASMWLGLEWNKYIFDKKHHVRLKAGYEVQYYWRVNMLEEAGGEASSLAIQQLSLDPENPQISVGTAGRYNNTHGSKDLMFYGITAEARLDF